MSKRPFGAEGSFRNYMRCKRVWKLSKSKSWTL